MLDQSIKSQVEQHLQLMRRPVELRLNLDQSDKSRELAALAEDLAGLSDLVTLSDESADGSRAPAMSIYSPEQGTQITFAGLPLGHEFSSLILALLQVGGHAVKMDAAQQQQIAELEGEHLFEVYVSLGCQTCPEVVQNLNMLAAVNPGIKTVMIDGALFQDEISSKNILAVPAVYHNGERFAQGRISLADILGKLDQGFARKSSQALSEKAPYDMLIVGAGPAGASAAIYAARKGLRTGLVAEVFGGQVADTLAIENFISVPATEGPKLVASLEEHVRNYDVDIMQGQRASAVKRIDGGQMVEVTLESGATLQSKSVLLATGARWRQINVPGEQEYKGRGVAYCPHCDGPLFKGKKVAVVGGGNSGIEAAIDLAGIVEHVTVLEYAEQLKADKVLVDKAASMSNIRIITGAATQAIEGDGQRVNALIYQSRLDGQEHQLDVAGVFIQIGLVPNTEFLQGSVDLNRFGEIACGPRGETSLPGVFAAGDVTDVPYKQIVIAMGSGANAALGAFDYLIRNSADAQGAEKEDLAA